MEEPGHGWSTEAEVLECVDGDTIKVRVSRVLTLRLLDCWTPESRTKDLEEKAAGLAAKAHLERLVPPGTLVTVFIPASGRGRLADILTLGRLLARVWAGGRELSELMRRAGHATKTKHLR